jgi:hypothetical protein
MTESLGISTDTNCYECRIIQQDSEQGYTGMTCMSCVEEQEGRDSVIVHAISDEGNLQHPRPLSLINSNPSGHEWTGETTRLPRPVRNWAGELIEFREEYLEPITNLVDRLFTVDTWIPPMYDICSDCHLQIHRQVACPNCN